MLRIVLHSLAACLLPALFGFTAAAEGTDDPLYARGKVVFNVCRGCHGLQPGQATLMKGPSLAGVMGRKAGSLPGYTGYSEAMRASGIVWSPEMIERYIANPKALVPGNKMAFLGVANADDRKALAAYLAKASIAQAPPASRDLGLMLHRAE